MAGIFKSLGPSFPEEISQMTLKSSHFKKPKEDSWQDLLLPNYNPETVYLQRNIWRVAIFIALTATAFFIIFLRLFHLQIVKGEENRKLADGNRVQVKIIHAPRGVIFDRNGKILAQNEPGFRWKAAQIGREEALKMEASSENLTDLEIDNIRVYPLGQNSAHLLGYVGEITAGELDNQKFKNYRLGDRVGRSGIEQAYESVLKGVDGGEIAEVDAKGQVKRILRKTGALPGQNLYLTIDSDLQTVVFNTLKEAAVKIKACCAAAIVQNPTTGEILALVSLPSFDPLHVESFLTAQNSPILNRVIAGEYPPGSIFKIASALAGLSSGKITAQTVFEDTGVVNIGPYQFSNWYFNQYGKVEGAVDIVRALKRSNDTFFYRLSQLTEEKVIGEGAKRLGLGKVLGIDIPGETAGLVPDHSWKVKNLGQVWFPGDTLHMAIGQGFVLVTPLQISNLVSIVAADGREYSAHLALRITEASGHTVKEFKPKLLQENTFSAKDIQLVKKGLAEVTKDGGTAWPFFDFPIPTAGKTGTAEFGDSNGKTHAWYTAFAPIDDPKLAVTVLIEGGGEGSSVSAPVAKEILRWYFSEDKKNLVQDLGGVASESARILGE